MPKNQAQVEDNEADVEATTITLAAICEEMGIKPQGARVKLRKKLGSETKGDGFRWVFDLDRKDEIVALLTPAAKAEAEAEEEVDEEEEVDA